MRGVAADPETVMVTSGLTQGLALTSRALAARGVRRIAVEEPGSADLRAPIASAGLEWVAIDVDGDGLDVAALERSEVGAVLVTPAHQYPTGVVLAPQRRAALLEWAVARDAFVLEDDYDAEYRYDRAARRGAAGARPATRRLHELGQQDAGARAEDRLARRTAGAGRGDPPREGHRRPRHARAYAARADGHPRARRARPPPAQHAAVYRRRRDALLAALARHLPGLQPQGAAAGLHLLVDLPDALDEGALVRAAESRGVGLDGLAPHSARPERPGVILGYGRIAEPAIERGVRALADAVHAVTMPA